MTWLFRVNKFFLKASGIVFNQKLTVNKRNEQNSNEHQYLLLSFPDASNA
jgi:hypothetical protein